LFSLLKEPFPRPLSFPIVMLIHLGIAGLIYIILQSDNVYETSSDWYPVAYLPLWTSAVAFIGPSLVSLFYGSAWKNKKGKRWTVGKQINSLFFKILLVALGTTALLYIHPMVYFNLDYLQVALVLFITVFLFCLTVLFILYTIYLQRNIRKGDELNSVLLYNQFFPSGSVAFSDMTGKKVQFKYADIQLIQLEGNKVFIYYSKSYNILKKRISNSVTDTESLLDEEFMYKPIDNFIVNLYQVSQVIANADSLGLYIPGIKFLIPIKKGGYDDLFRHLTGLRTATSYA